MGKRGPQQKDQQATKLLGGWRAKAREKTTAELAQCPVPDVTFPDCLIDPAKAFAEQNDLTQIIKLIPNYDPYANGATDEYYFDPIAAAKPISFCHDYLKHYEGQFAGKPFLLEQWQQAIFANIWGWKHKETHLRRYRVVYVEVGIGNGKSMMGAAVALYLLLCDGENAPQVYGAAYDRDQARVVFKSACAMRDQNAILAKFIEHKRAYNALQVTDYDVYRVLSAGAEGKAGLNIHGLIFDELRTQRDRSLWDELLNRRRSRTQPLVYSMSTAGTDMDADTSVWWEQRNTSERIIKGELIDHEFLPVLYVNPVDADWHDEATWRRANPNFGKSVNEHQFRKDYTDACNIPAHQNRFKLDHLCIPTEANEIWLPLDKWKECQRKIDVDKLKGQPCYGGWDMGQCEDLTCFALWFPNQQAVLIWTWMPDANLQDKERLDRASYRQWETIGYSQTHKFIEFCAGESVDYDQIEKRIFEIYKEYKPRKIGVDRALVLPIAQHLLDKRVPLEAVIQGNVTLSYPCVELERMVITKQLNHLGNPVLQYCAMNTALKRDFLASNESMKPIKANRNGRIDAMLALLDALTVQLRDTKRYTSIYSTMQPKVG